MNSQPAYLRGRGRGRGQSLQGGGPQANGISSHSQQQRQGVHPQANGTSTPNQWQRPGKGPQANGTSTHNQQKGPGPLRSMGNAWSNQSNKNGASLRSPSKDSQHLETCKEEKCMKIILGLYSMPFSSCSSAPLHTYIGFGSFIVLCCLFICYAVVVL